VCSHFIFVRNSLKCVDNLSGWQGCFPCLPCFHHSHLVFTYILASVPFLKALFVSFMFLVWIILKYEIHLGNILYIHVEG
uniref:Uncharacterized protein n=1 Tax=Ficedula albicollis TaxID=59894 RepID=A0A803WGM4_FICAL